MTDGPTQPPEDDRLNPEDGPILSPEELQLEDDDHVTKIDEGRFVVSPDGRSGEGTPNSGTASTADTGTSQPEADADPASDEPPATDGTDAPRTSVQPAPGTSPGTPDDSPLTEREVHDWIQQDLAGTRSRYSFDVTAKFDDSVTQRRMASNDVITIFESLVVWYAQGIDRDTPVEEVLGILLMEANVPIRFPAASIQQLVQSSDLGPEDSIGDLLAAVEAQDGFRL